MSLSLQGKTLASCLLVPYCRWCLTGERSFQRPTRLQWAAWDFRREIAHACVGGLMGVGASCSAQFLCFQAELDPRASLAFILASSHRLPHHHHSSTHPSPPHLSLLLPDSLPPSHHQVSILVFLTSPSTCVLMFHTSPAIPLLSPRLHYYGLSDVSVLQPLRERGPVLLLHL